MVKKHYLFIICLTLIKAFSTNVVGQEDINSPVLNSISISNENIIAGDEITFIINAIDDQSGLNYAILEIKNPTGQQAQQFGGSFSDNWSDMGNNDYSISITLDEFAISGEWYVSSILIGDNAGNQFSKYSFNEEILKFNVVNNSNEDSTAPIFNSISISDENVIAGAEVTFIINATDDMSELSIASFIIKNDEGGQSQIFGGHFSCCWTDLGDNNYSISNTLDESAVPGVWYVYYISIIDSVGNKCEKYSYNEELLRFNVAINTLNEKVYLQNDVSIVNLNQNEIMVKSSIEVQNVKVYDLNGKEIIVLRNTNNSYLLNSNIKGLYIVKIITENGIVTKKIII